MPRLTIRLTRGRDKPDTLSCTREDGSVAWQKLHSAFPIHDITHYAVECTLGLAGGFFGLLAQGWEITDFEKPYPRGRIPDEALWAELVVSVFWRTFVQRDALDCDDLQEQLAATLEGYRGGYSRAITDDDIVAIRALQGELAARWTQTAPGVAMELEFSAS